MKLEIEIAGASHTVEMSQGEAKCSYTIDDTSVNADAVEVAPGIYSILIDGHSFEVRIALFGSDLRASVGSTEYALCVSDPRKWERNRGSAASSEGRQYVSAPMPGRVVRVLAKPGDSVIAGQGIVVVEAMKMQNEVRSPKEGRVERIFVKEGQPVNAGEVIAIVA